MVGRVHVAVSMRTGYVMLPCLVVMRNVNCVCWAVLSNNLRRLFVLLGVLLFCAFLLATFKFGGFCCFVRRAHRGLLTSLSHYIVSHLVMLTVFSLCNIGRAKALAAFSWKCHCISPRPWPLTESLSGALEQRP